MARTWLWMKPWRWAALALGVVVPLVVVVSIQVFEPPSALRFDSPQPRVVAVGYREAMGLLEKGDLAGAQKRLEALRDDSPLNPLLSAALGQVHRQAGRLPEAIAATRMAVALDPRLGEGWYNLACDLAKSGQPEEALRALRQAVKAGFDARTPAERDPDLVALRGDQRLQVYLEGAGTIPFSDRSATLRVTPDSPVVGQPFDLELELLALNQPVAGTPLEVTVAFRGPAEVEVLAPIRVERLREETAGKERKRYRWLYRYRVVARAHFAGQVGPWEVQIGGVAVPVEAPTLVVAEGAPEGGGTSVLEVPDTVPALQADQFFGVPGPIRDERPGVHIGDAPWGAGWASGAVVLSVSPLPAGGTAAVDAHFESGLAPLGEYDELELSSDGRQVLRMRRVYAFAREVLPMVEKAPVSVKIGAQRASLRIVPPADETGSRTADGPRGRP